MAHKILMIDDEKAVVEIIKDILEKRNYEVDVAFDGTEGLEKIKSGAVPDLIICDIRMPSMNGYEFMRALRALLVLDEKEMLPVVMLTASDAMEDVFKLEGAKGYLVKPVEDDELIREIEKCLGPNV